MALTELEPARAPRDFSREARLMVIDARARPGALRAGTLQDLEAEFNAGDVLVVNDAATFPGSFQVTVARTLERLEVRLLPAAHPETEGWDAILLGEGSWRERTEDRRAPPVLLPGELLHFSEGPGAFRAEVVQVSEHSKRLVRLRFEAADPARLWREVYRLGKPIQYSYLSRELKLWSVQTLYGGRPWASEMPSAGKPLSAGLLLALRRKGVRIVALTHATGISSSGDPELDRLLPLPEFYDIPETAAAAMNAAVVHGRRIVAVGTSVVRALESQPLASSGRVATGPGRTSLRIHPGHRLRVVSGILSGVHEFGESHFELLGAFASLELLQSAVENCRKSGFLSHEFGDSSLIWKGSGGKFASSVDGSS